MNSVRNTTLGLILATLLAPGSAPADFPDQWTRDPGNPIRPAMGGCVLFHDGVYKMWGGLNGFDYATSPDGRSWTTHPASPVLVAGPGWYDALEIANATVVIVGGQYHLWYSGVAADQHSRIAHATSPDGIVWTKDAANPVMDLGLPGSLDDQELIHPFAIYESPRFRLWYNGYGGTPDAQRILYAESLDGVSWTRHPVAAIDLGNPGDWDDTQLYMMCVVRFAGLYTMFYTASNTSSEFGIGYATSPDAITWSRRNPSAPVLSPGLPGAWDDLAVARPIVVQSGPEFLLWYGGTRDFQTFSWGLATAATPTDVAIPSESSSGLHVGPVRPNPSSGVVSLATTSRTMTFAEIEVVDVLGRRVWFGTRRVPAGTGRIEWPGRDRDGNLVSPGTYVVRVRLAGEEHRRKVVVVR